MAGQIRLYFDEDAMRSAIIQALRSRNVDVITARDASLTSRPDEDHLAYASAQSRVLFTFNRGHFARLHLELLANNSHHAGIVVSDQLETGVIVRRLLRLLNNRSADEMCDAFEFLSNWR
jgi:hypothetical protein